MPSDSRGARESRTVAGLTFRDVERKARYGHRDWVVWRDDKGQMHAEKISADSMKMALLACGFKRTFTMVCADGVSMLMRWNIGINVWKNAKRGYL